MGGKLSSRGDAPINPAVDERMEVASVSSFGSLMSRLKKPPPPKRESRRYRDPPMPFLGKPVTYSIMTDRYKKAKIATRTICESVQRDVADAVTEARIIPVSDDTERVRISSDVQDRIARRRNKKDIKYNVMSNKLDTQKNLLYRKHMLNMMNHNYSEAVVRHLEPVNVEVARDTIEYQVAPPPQDDDQREYADEGVVYYDDD